MTILWYNETFRTIQRKLKRTYNNALLWLAICKQDNVMQGVIIFSSQTIGWFSGVDYMNWFTGLILTIVFLTSVNSPCVGGNRRTTEKTLDFWQSID